MSNIHTRKRRKKGTSIASKKRKKENDKEKRKSLKMTDDWRLTKINKDEF